MNYRDVILSRKSCRSYTDKPVEKEKLEQVITSASLSPIGNPSAGKPHLTVVTDENMLKKLDGLGSSGRSLIYGAPALIIVSCLENGPGLAEMNAACAIELMSLTATDLGLGSIYLYGVTMAINKSEELKKELGIPEGHTPLSALAVGYGTEEVKICKEFVQTFPRNDI
jgi:nitroreductase